MAVVINDFSMNLPHEYYPAIGEFIFRFGQLEHQLHIMLCVTLDLDPKSGRILTVGAPVKAIRGMIETAISPDMRGYYISDSQRKLLQKMHSLLNKCRGFDTLRNKLAHGAWEYAINGKFEDVGLVYVKERDQKYLAKKDKSVNAAYIHKECAKLKSANLAAKFLLIDLFEFRRRPTSHLHDRKNVS